VLKSIAIVLGRSIAIHSNIDTAQIIACANIEPEILSRTELRIAFEVPFDASLDIRYVFFEKSEQCLLTTYMLSYSVSLPVAIVDALNDTDVEYGEVLVYDLDTQGVRFSFIDCHVATLRFTDFNGT